MSFRSLLAITFVGRRACCGRRKQRPRRPNSRSQAGTKVPLSLINSVSTKHSAEGDRVYLETVFPGAGERAHRGPGGQLRGRHRDADQEAGAGEGPRANSTCGSIR